MSARKGAEEGGKEAEGRAVGEGGLALVRALNLHPAPWLWG